MSLNSVNTNMGAMVALQSLENTQSQLTATQKQISTGYRVADSTDDGAAYAIAQTIRSTVGALTSANQQLGNVAGLLSTTQTGLNSISNNMNSMRDVLIKLGDSTTTGAERTQYANTYNKMLFEVKSAIEDASYSGKTLIGDISANATTGDPGSSGTFSRVAVTRNENGASYGIATYSGSALFGSISFGTTTTSTAAVAANSTLGTAAIAAGTVHDSTSTLGSSTNAAALITAGGVFIRMQASVNNALAQVGNSINYVNSQTTFNSDKIDALNGGLGSLVDADLAKESAQLTALQIRQQLGTQALSLANQAPQTLLSLFK
jgi:flagellin